MTNKVEYDAQAGGSQTLANLGINTTGGQIYLVEYDTGEKLEVQFVPEQLSTTRSANYADVAVLMRNTPHQIYTGGSKSLAFTLDFYADEESRSSVIQKVKWLERLAASDGYRKSPSKVILVWGKLYRDEVWRLRSVGAKLGNFSKPHGFLPQQAYVDITLTLDPDHNLGREEIYSPSYAGEPDGGNPFDAGQARANDDAGAKPYELRDLTLEDYIKRFSPFK